MLNKYVIIAAISCLPRVNVGNATKWFKSNSLTGNENIYVLIFVPLNGIWLPLLLRPHYSNQTSLLPSLLMHSLITRFLGPTCGPSGADRTQVGPVLAPCTLLSGLVHCIARSSASIVSTVWTWPFHPWGKSLIICATLVTKHDEMKLCFMFPQNN